jgi:hypothetical protein
VIYTIEKRMQNMIDNSGLQGNSIAELYSSVLSDMVRVISMIDDIAEAVANSPCLYLVYRDVIIERLEVMSKLHLSNSQNLDCAVQEQMTCVANDTLQLDALASVLCANDQIGRLIDSVRRLCSSIDQ